MLKHNPNRTARKIGSEISSFWKPHELLLPIIREEPGKGFRHFLSKRDVLQFIQLLPEWSLLSQGLTSIVLAKGNKGEDGWYSGTQIGINAWERDTWRWVPPDYFIEHRLVFKRLDIECIKQGREYLCKFDLFTVKAFQLLHVFLHELGHHYDKITTKSRKEASRGEIYAEEYAHKYEELIWEKYLVITER